MNYYIIAASKDHVEIGKANGFAQSGHGKKAQLEKLNKDDWVIYYSSKDQLKDGKTLSEIHGCRSGDRRPTLPGRSQP